MTPSRDFRQHLEVETPEHVVLDYEIAGIGSRALAAILDSIILAIWSVALSLVFGLLAFGLGDWTFAVLGVLIFASVWGYFTFFEGFRGGQTPGKRRLGIRVVRDTGHPLTFGAAAARNLLRVADFLPPPYLIGAISVALHPRGKRLGDLVAGTVVVRDRPVEHPVRAEPARCGRGAGGAGVPELADEEFRLLREFAERAPSLAAAVRARLALPSRRNGSRHAIPSGPPTPTCSCATLYHDELARRRGRFGARGTGRRRAAPRRRERGGRAAGGAQVRALGRVPAARRPGHAASGSTALPPSDLPDFAARYREVAADLARARTYRRPPGAPDAAGAPGGRRAQRPVPRRAPHRPAGLAVPDARMSGRHHRGSARRPARLPHVHPAGGGRLPAAAGATRSWPRSCCRPRCWSGPTPGWHGNGKGAATTRPRPTDRPFMASRIMTNNIGVAFYCFAGGIFAGVGSLLLLAFNGLAMGTISGHFANLGLLGYLWTFVVGHGVLELFAIWVAGAAGFLLGRALLAPGERTRAEALVTAGRLALRMVGAVHPLPGDRGADRGIRLGQHRAPGLPRHRQCGQPGVPAGLSDEWVVYLRRPAEAAAG